MFCIEAQLPGRQPLAQDNSAEASYKPVYGQLPSGRQPVAGGRILHSLLHMPLERSKLRETTCDENHTQRQPGQEHGLGVRQDG